MQTYLYIKLTVRVRAKNSLLTSLVSIQLEKQNKLSFKEHLNLQQTRIPSQIHWLIFTKLPVYVSLFYSTLMNVPLTAIDYVFSLHNSHHFQSLNYYFVAVFYFKSKRTSIRKRLVCIGVIELLKHTAL